MEVWGAVEGESLVRSGVEARTAARERVGGLVLKRACENGFPFSQAFPRGELRRQSWFVFARDCW